MPYSSAIPVEVELYCFGRKAQRSDNLAQEHPACYYYFDMFYYNRSMPPFPREDKRLLTDAEIEVMQHIWNKGGAAASSVQMQLVREGKDFAYTTVKMTLDRLVKSGICSAKEIKAQHVYTPLMSRDEIARFWLKHLNEKIFGKFPKIII